jgi:hypothetical protein
VRYICLICGEHKHDVSARLYEEGDTRTGRPIIKYAPTCAECYADFPKWKDEHWHSMKLVDTSAAD